MGHAMPQNWVVSQTGANTFSYGSIAAGTYVLVVTDAGGNVKSQVPVKKM
jgi:hypothetical protein